MLGTCCGCVLGVMGCYYSVAATKAITLECLMIKNAGKEQEENEEIKRVTNLLMLIIVIWHGWSC